MQDLASSFILRSYTYKNITFKNISVFKEFAQNKCIISLKKSEVVDREDSFQNLILVNNSKLIKKRDKMLIKNEGFS